jgi:hypothetical protein
LLNDFAPDPNDSSVILASGCLAIGETEVLTPLAARAVDRGEGNFDLTVLGTVSGHGEAFTIRLTGVGKTFGPGVKDDSVSGQWTTAESDGYWSAVRHDWRRSHCPPVDDVAGLYFQTDIAVDHRYFGDELVERSTLMQGDTNVVSASMLVERPDGTTTVVPSFTDIFSPNVDFISEFRYQKNEPGDAVSGEGYTFTLLDPLGNPIPGMSDTDIWTACLPAPPRNLEANMVDLNIDLSWNAVSVEPGFDPGNQIGSYQVWINPLPAGGPFVYGANFVSSTRHLIPWNDFGGHAAGNPDGFDNGAGLSELDNGDYEIGGDSISVPAPGNPGHGIECVVRDFAEKLFFTKFDSDISFFTP